MIAAYYAAHKSEFKTPSTRAVRYILLGKNKADLAAKLFTQLDGAPRSTWCTLAKKYSQDPGSKDKGGHFTATQGSDVPEFDKAVFATTAKTGQLLKPVNSSQYGWFVIKPVGNISVGKVTTEKTFGRRRARSRRNRTAKRARSASHAQAADRHGPSEGGRRKVAREGAGQPTDSASGLTLRA